MWYALTLILVCLQSQFTAIQGKLEVGDDGGMVLKLRVGETARVNALADMAMLVLHCLSQ